MAPASVEAAPEPDGAGACARILVADDNADMRDYIVRLVGARWAVETACDGAAALESARRRPFRTWSCRTSMMRLDGFGLLQEMRRDPALRRARRSSSCRRAPERKPRSRRVLDAGADDYLIKPFSGQGAAGARSRTRTSRCPGWAQRVSTTRSGPSGCATTSSPSRGTSCARR